MREHTLNLETVNRRKGIPAPKILLPWLVALAIILLAITLFPRAYSENDDVGIVFLLERGFHPPFVSTYLSECLIRLYRWQPGIPWYGIYHYAMLWLALGLSLRLGSGAVKNRWAARLLGLGLALIFLNFVTQITFTYTGLLLCGIGLLSFLTLKVHKEAGKQELGWPFLTGLVFAMGWATRFESPAAMAALLPLLLYVAWKRKHRLRAMCLPLLVFLLPLLCGVALEAVHPLSIPAERTHYSFLKSAGKLVGVRYTRSQDDRDLSQAGWTSTDLTLLKHFLFIDEDKFSGTRIEQVATHSGRMILASAGNLLQPALLTKALGAFCKEVWYSQRNLSLLFLGTVILAATFSRTGSARRLALLYVPFIFISAFSMFYFIRFPERLGYPVFWITSLGVLATSGMTFQDPLHKPRRALALTVAATLLLIAIGGTFYQINKMHRKIAAHKRDEQALTMLANRHFIMRSSNVIFSKWLDPLKTSNIGTVASGPGWLVFSPVFYSHIRRFGLSQGSQVLPWMINNPRGLFITKKQHIPLIRQFIQETYHRQVTAIPIGYLPSHRESLIYRLQSSPQN